MFIRVYEVENHSASRTSSCFQPSIQYLFTLICATLIPIWAIWCLAAVRVAAIVAISIAICCQMAMKEA